MIIVRNVFRLKFGKAKEAKAHIKEAVEFNKSFGLKHVRAMIDLTGPSYTLVFETGHDSLASFEADLGRIFADEKWGEMYEKLKPFCESGYREIFTVVE
ncbi:MAG: hypothetical protein LWX07_13255 [Bacteroidetes bacterium]|nr:hypothetical protein [Bacteroidota bacterium]